jgi:hypothetical protein
MPKSYRVKQGNHQLLLWTKHAHMTFEIYDDIIEGPQQTYITDWLQSWQPSSEYLNDTSTTPSDDDLISTHSDTRLTIPPI